MTTIWVQATRTDRKVILSEADEAHPLDANGGHEVFIAGYPDVTRDDGVKVPGNPPIEVGDTGTVRQRIAAGDLVEVSAPSRLAAERETQAGTRAADAAAKGAK